MKICLIGDGLTNLSLAKTLVDRNIKVFLYHKSKKNKSLTTRTLGISSKNHEFIQDKIVQINKFSWPINKIKIFSEKNKDNELLTFSNKDKKLFYIINNYKFYKKLENILKLKKNFKKIRIKNQNFYKKILKNNQFDLVINSEKNNLISKKIFYNKIIKDYKSTAFTVIIKHKKCINDKATQIFTNAGPLAFLPISNFETSIVYSVHNKNNYNEKKIKKLINQYNKIYEIKSFSKFEKFYLKFSTNRKYYYKNILCFGDNLHTIHPLAGQGFNMTLRDIKFFLNIVEYKLNLGLPLDISVLKEFEKKTKHKNYIFSVGIDFIYEFFKFDIKKNYSKNILAILEKNNIFKKYMTQFANNGI